MYAVEVDKNGDKSYDRAMNSLDLMAKSQQFVVGDKIRVSAKQVRGSKYDIWLQVSTKKIRDTMANVIESLETIEGVNIPRIVIVKHSRLNAFAGYNQAQDILFISDLLHSKAEVVELLLDNYFVSTDISGILKHELTHKQHWDSAKEFYKRNKKRTITLKAQRLP